MSKIIRKGSPEQFKDCVEDRIKELGGQVQSCSHIKASIDDDPTFEDRYLHDLMRDIQNDLSINFEGLEFDTTDSELVIKATRGGEVTEITVPYEDLSFDFDDIETDVANILEAVES